MSLTRSLSGRLAASALLALTATSFLAAAAEVTVFNDTFASGSTVNDLGPIPAAPSLTATAYQVMSAKTYPEAPSIAANNLRFGLPATSSAVIQAEALFTTYPINLPNVGDYVELTVVFTSETAMMDYDSSGIFLGLYNSGGNQPYLGGKQSNSANPGFAQTWAGYVARFMSNGGAHRFYTRPSQGTSGKNQDVVYEYSSAQLVNGSSDTSTLAAFPADTQYTGVFRITRASEDTNEVTETLYSGSTTAGTLLMTKDVTSKANTANQFVATQFDALAVGFRASAASTGDAHVQFMKVNSIKVTTNAATTIVPVILTQPASQVVIIGDNTTLSVEATGGGAALSYQWKKGGIDIDGAVSSSYNIPSAAVSDAGTYSVVVTDVAGSVTSDNATLGVVPPSPPTITADPTGQSAALGGSATFTVVASGNGLSYQWQKSVDGGDYVEINGATSDSYNVSGAQSSAIGMYRAVVTNSAGTVTSAGAALDVTFPVIGLTPSGYGSEATGGGNAAAVVVKTAAAFKTQAESSGAAVITVQGTLTLSGKVSVKSDKTIQGIDGEATIVGNLELASGVSNVVIRGLNITNSGGSGVTISGASKVYISHVSLYDCTDSLLSITSGADNVTVTWSEFYFSTAAATNRAILIGSATGETKPIHVTFDHNWLSDGIATQMPETTYGYVHMYNNLLKPAGSGALGNTTGTRVLANAQLFSERNQYTQITAPLAKDTTTNALIRTLGNVYTSSSGAYAGTDFITFAPTYSYQLQKTSSLTSGVPADAGNTAGASSTTPATEGTASITGTASSVPVNGSFTLTAVTTGLTLAETNPIQWRLNGAELAGRTGNEITINGVASSSAGNYTVAATLASGDTVVSTPFTVEVTSGASTVPASESEGAGGGGAPSFWFMGALAMLAGIRRFVRR
jgi:hypothetical protein